MKSIKKVLALALALAMLVTAVPATTAEAATTGIPTKKTYYGIGKTYTLKLTTPKSWKNVKTTWSEKNSAISLSSKKAKSVKVKALKATKLATVKAKVTYAKSSKKGAKRYTKNYTCKITIKKPTFTVSVENTTLTIGDKAAIKVKKTPSVATVTYSTDDPAIVSIYDGTINANSVGTATVTAKLSYGKYSTTKKIPITVVAGKEDGISTTLTNPVNDEYTDVVLTKNAATFQLYYGKNGKGVENATLSIECKKGGKDYVDSYGRANYVTSVTTDANGLATFKIYSRDTVEKVDYTITALATGEKKTGSVSFAEVSTDNIFNINGFKEDDTDRKIDYDKLGYKSLKVSDNDTDGRDSGNGLTWTAGTLTIDTADAAATTAVPQYYSEYVNSQQVSKDTEHQVGFIGGLPRITLPGESSAINAATTFTQAVDKTSGKYHVNTNSSEYVELNVDPNELTYATMNFSSLKLSDYTALKIETFKSKADAEADKNQLGNDTTVYGPHNQTNFSYQIPLTAEGAGKGLCVKVTLMAAGQVDTGMNDGYVIKDITGVYKSKTDGNGDTTVLLKGASIKWEKVTPKFSEERPLKMDDITGAAFAKDVKLFGANENVGSYAITDAAIAKTTYCVPVFPYTGNAVITTYDKNSNVIAYYACPTYNDGDKDLDPDTAPVSTDKINTNVLDTRNTSFVYQISKEEAFNNVGEITSQDNDFVTVNSKLAGTTTIVGKISGVEGLDATADTVYTSVQWNPVDATTTTTNSAAFAFAGQSVKLTAQLIDANGNAVSTAGQPITFYDGKNNEIKKNTSLTTINGVVTGGPVTVVDADVKTDSLGQAKLTLDAAKVTTIEGIYAKAANSSYKVVFSVDKTEVTALDVYWIEAKTQFTSDVLSTGVVHKEDKVSGVCAPEVGSAWEYGFEMQEVKLYGGVYSGAAVTITDAKIAVNVVANDLGKGTNPATVNALEGVNGGVTATSTKNGLTTLEASVDGTPVTGKNVTFTVKDKGTFTSVGTGTVTPNKQKLEIAWGVKGLKGSFDTLNGSNASTDAAFTLYFKVADNFGNAISDAAVSVVSNQGTVSAESLGTALNESQVSGTVVTPAAVVTGKDGLVKISVTNTGKTNGEKEIITATVDNVAYTFTVTWNAVAATANAVLSGDSLARDENDKLVTNWDGNTITLTYADDILASSVDPEQFIATYSGDGSRYAVESATVSGNKIILKVKNAPASTSIDKTYSVQIKTIKKGGITVTPKTVKGSDITNASVTVYNIAQ